MGTFKKYVGSRFPVMTLPPHPSPLFLLARLPIIKIVTICIEIFSKFSSISFFFFISYLGITELEGITFSYS